jgi:glycerol-3-phosphate dehydrogenase (NAD(P)+)
LSLHESVTLEPDLGRALSAATAVVLVVPSQVVASVAQSMRPLLDAANPALLVLASKGIETRTLRTLTAILEDELPGFPNGVISGPCIAREVARRIPTSVVAASTCPDGAARIRDLFAADHLRVYTQPDVLGVELGGALKNVIAIAAGICDGLGFGANSKSALMTRGLAEIARLAIALGAERSTVYGLAGLGDLSVTCFSPHSRNRTFGEHLGKGLSPAAAREAIGMIVEGEPTASAALQLAGRHGLEMPVTEAVRHVCDGEWTPRQAVEALMQRELKSEAEPTPA